MLCGVVRCGAVRCGRWCGVGSAAAWGGGVVWSGSVVWVVLFRGGGVEGCGAVCGVRCAVCGVRCGVSGGVWWCGGVVCGVVCGVWWCCGVVVLPKRGAITFGLRNHRGFAHQGDTLRPSSSSFDLAKNSGESDKPRQRESLNLIPSPAFDSPSSGCLGHGSTMKLLSREDGKIQ